MRKLENNELDRIGPAEFLAAPKMPVVVVLDNIRSCHNTGSVFRTADALLVEKIYLCGITATPPDKEIRKTALGAENTVAWEYHASTLELVNKLREAGYLLIAVEQIENSVNLRDFIPPENRKLALIFGNEVKGVQQEVADQCNLALEIPQYGTKHSFNISVSAGIVLWEIFGKMQTLPDKQTRHHE